MSQNNDNNNDNKEPEETRSPVVNAVRQSTPTWVDQFHKFIVDLTGVVDDKKHDTN
jgi:hypothetical protein